MNGMILFSGCTGKSYDENTVLIQHIAEDMAKFGDACSRAQNPV